MINTASNITFRGTQSIVNSRIKKVANFVHNVELQIGDYKSSAHTNDFNGWLLCDGRSVAISDYPKLYKVIGNSFGAVDDSHFNIPKFYGRVYGAIGSTENTGDVTHPLGHNIGAENITLTIDQMPTHHHTGTTDYGGIHNHEITDPGHAHSYFNQPNTTNPAVSLTTESVADNSNVNQETGNSTTGIIINNDGNHVHTFTSNDTGGNTSHSNVQPTLYGGNMFIFAAYLPYI